MLGDDGFIGWLLKPFGIGSPGDQVGLWLTFTYFWLPFMILPVYAGLERIPSSLLEASGDLGARSLRTFWKVTLPLAFPAVVAGSIFTFSLTLGDFILPTLIAKRAVHRDGDLQRPERQPAGGGGVRDGADRRHDRLSRRRTTAGSLQGAVVPRL